MLTALEVFQERRPTSSQGEQLPGGWRAGEASIVLQAFGQIP